MVRPFVAFALLALASTTGCFRARWEGTQGLTRRVPERPGAIIAAAETALREHGYTPEVVDSTQLVTLPQPVPAIEGSMAGAAGAGGSLWVLQVLAVPENAAAGVGSRVTVTGYVVPGAGRTAADSTGRMSVKVTEQSDARLYAEVRRIGDWILEATKRR